MLIAATLLRRYKRFLADVRMENGEELCVHCPNPGAMTGLAQPESTVWLRPATKGAKLPYRWQMIETPTSLVGIDTGLANKIVAEALDNHRIPALARYTRIQPEIRLSSLDLSGSNLTEGNFSALSNDALAKTRLDFCLFDGEERYFLEVKSVTLRDDATECALFPDSRTERGLKHLHSLIALRKMGFSAGILYVVQRSDCNFFDVATKIDPHYAKGYTHAAQAGVDMMAWDCDLLPTTGVRLRKPLTLLDFNRLDSMQRSS